LKLKALIDNKEKRVVLGSNGKRRVEEQFNDSYSSHLLDLFRH